MATSLSSPQSTTVQLSCSDFRVALVGRRLSDNENLGLGYLAAALAEAGFACEQLQLNEARDLARVGQSILRGGFQLLGLSIADGGSAYLPLALGEYLRQHGFAKPITSGGSFATLARHWLLDRYPWLHSVVRFAGEVPLVALARAIHDGSDLAGIPGLTTRAGDGLPAPVLDAKPLWLRPARAELPQILGHRAAHVMATRGCAGRCGYCAPASLQTQEWREGVRAGLASEVLRRAGVGHVRRRPVEDLCDEMAWLWRERDVRYFYFVDEHMLPYGEDEALAFLDQMGRGLRRRKVGPLGIGTMLRVDRLTKRVVRAFAEVGLVRAFAGIEFSSAAEARSFGRTCDPSHAHAMVAELEKSGVATVAHLMMVHPYSSRETITQAIRFLEAAPAGVFELTQMRVYHGTWLWRRMREAGRLGGNPMRYAYTMPDEWVARFNDIFMELRATSFWNHSIAYRTHDAFLAQALAKRLRPDLRLGTLPAKTRALRNELVALYVESYRRALALAESGAPAGEIVRLVEEARAKSVRLQETLDDLVGDLACRLHASPHLFSPSRAAAAGALALTLLGASCGRTSPPTRSDGGSATGRDTAGDATFTILPGPDSSCTSEQQSQVQTAALAAAPCFSGTIAFPNGQPSVTPGYSSPTPGNSGYCYAYLCSASNDGGTLPSEDEWVSKVKNAVAGLDVRCLGPGQMIYGEADTQIQQITDALVSCETYLGEDQHFTVTVDADGRVVGTTGVAAEVSDCLVRALDGLVFPCLAGAAVCGGEQILVE